MYVPMYLSKTLNCKIYLARGQGLVYYQLDYLFDSEINGYVKENIKEYHNASFKS